MRTIRVALGLACTLLAASASSAYWNLDPKAGISGGAHRAINRCAWDLFVTTQEIGRASCRERV